MIKISLNLALLAIVSLLVACDNGSDTGQPLSREINITTPMFSRVTDKEFEPGDRVTIYAYESGDPLKRVVDGVVNTKKVDGWIPAMEMLWKDDVTAHDFVAVYPELDIIDFTAGSFTVTDDPVANDLLVATASHQTVANNPVILNFSHVMSRVVVNLSFENSSTFPVEKVVLVCRTMGTVNYITRLTTILSSSPFSEIRMIPGVGDLYTAVTLPQTLEANADMVVISVKGKDYIFAHASPIELEPGKTRVINLIVNDDGLLPGTVSISDWGYNKEITGGEANEVSR